MYNWRGFETQAGQWTRRDNGSHLLAYLSSFNSSNFSLSLPGSSPTLSQGFPTLLLPRDSSLTIPCSSSTTATNPWLSEDSPNSPARPSSSWSGERMNEQRMYYITMLSMSCKTTELLNQWLGWGLWLGDHISWNSWRVARRKSITTCRER